MNRTTKSAILAAIQGFSFYFGFLAFRQKIRELDPRKDLVAVIVPGESRLEVAKRIKELLKDLQIEGFVIPATKKNDSSVGDVIKDPAAAPSPGLESHLDNNEGKK